MRLWSVHPRYLDRQALTACWREALLAQSVLHEPRRGYTRHPQLDRFRAEPAPLEAIGAFLAGVAAEAEARGYRFDRQKIRCLPPVPLTIPVTTGQLGYEWTHLIAKLQRRSPDVAALWSTTTVPDPHPLFTPVPGPIAPWERPRP